MSTNLRMIPIVAVVLLAAATYAVAQESANPTSGPAKTSEAVPSGQVEKAAVTPVPATAAPAAAPVDPTEAWIQQVKNPTPWLSWGADFRARNEYYNNVKTLNDDVHGHEANYQRYRTRLWTVVTPVKDVEINTRVAWEFRNYCVPSGPLRDTDPSDAIFDLLNTKWKNILGSPLTLTLGRQEITNLGNGWLVLEGTPLDGSRTIFFDAARATLDFKDSKTTLDTIYVNQGAKANKHIEPFNYDNGRRNEALSEQDEQGAIVWLTNRAITKTELSGYFIYKHDGERVLPTGQEGDIYTFGLRAAGDVGDNWKYNADLAPQFGHKDGQDLCALGFNSKAAYFVKDPLNNNFRVAYEFLSGDNPNTKDKNEGFDILWGRYPQWSELYAFTSGLDTGRPAYYTNLDRVGPGWSFNPVKKLEIATDYYLLFANHNPNRDRPNFSDDGKFRGQLLTWVARYKFNDHISTHVWAEFFWPGDYYANPADNAAVFLRYEIMFTW